MKRKQPSKTTGKTKRETTLARIHREARRILVNTIGRADVATIVMQYILTVPFEMEKYPELSSPLPVCGLPILAYIDVGISINCNDVVYYSYRDDKNSTSDIDIYIYKTLHDHELYKYCERNPPKQIPRYSNITYKVDEAKTSVTVTIPYWGDFIINDMPCDDIKVINTQFDDTYPCISLQGMRRSLKGSAYDISMSRKYKFDPSADPPRFRQDHGWDIHVYNERTYRYKIIVYGGSMTIKVSPLSPLDNSETTKWKWEWEFPVSGVGGGSQCLLICYREPRRHTYISKIDLLENFIEACLKTDAEPARPTTHYTQPKIQYIRSKKRCTQTSEANICKLM